MPKTKADTQREYEKRTNYAAQKKYNALHSVTRTLTFNREKDADIISWLDAQPNKLGYIKSLIRADIAKHTTE